VTREIFYLDKQRNKHDLGEVAVGRWREMQSLLPLLIAYVNRLMAVPWHSGRLANVTIDAAGILTPDHRAADEPSPEPRPFILRDFLEDWTDGFDEIYITDADELQRLFAWCDFLARRDGAYELYAPLVEAVRLRTRRIDQFVGGSG
jgi:hypothetical protein